MHPIGDAPRRQESDDCILPDQEIGVRCRNSPAPTSPMTPSKKVYVQWARDVGRD